MASASSSEIKTTIDLIHFVGTFTESTFAGFTSEKTRRLQLGSSMAPGSMTGSSGEFAKSSSVYFGRFHIFKTLPIQRTDWDAGFVEGRQYGRGKTGGQVGNNLFVKINGILDAFEYILNIKYL